MSLASRMRAFWGMIVAGRATIEDNAELQRLTNG